MPIGDPRDGFFYPTLTLMIDTYNLKCLKQRKLQSGVQEKAMNAYSHTIT